MRLVNSIRIMVAELMHNLSYPVVVLRDEGISNEALELECAALALVVELIVERFGDVGVHIDNLRRPPFTCCSYGFIVVRVAGGVGARGEQQAGALVVASTCDACMLHKSLPHVIVPPAKPSLPNAGS